MRRAAFAPQSETARSERAVGGLGISIPASIRDIPADCNPITLPEVAERFGLPLSTLYRLAKGAPDNGVPIIKFSANHFRVNPRRFAEWLYAEAPGDILSGKHAGKGRSR